MCAAEHWFSIMVVITYRSYNISMEKKEKSGAAMVEKL
jgi:hypothetical protein